MIRSLFGISTWIRPSLSVLIFHRVHAQPDPLFPDEPCAEVFASMLDWLKGWGEILPLDQALTKLRAGDLPRRAFAITFDDGYADNADVALPVLQQAGVSATFFVATDYLSGGCMWNDRVIHGIRHAPAGMLDLNGSKLGQYDLGDAASRRSAIDQILAKIKHLAFVERDALSRLIGKLADRDEPQVMMSPEQVRRLSDAGMLVGAHTCSHPILKMLDDHRAHSEIRESKRLLSDITGREIDLFAYPNGKPGEDYMERHVRMVQEAGFRGALSTVFGAATAASDPFQIPRYTPWSRKRLRFGLQLWRESLNRASQRPVLQGSTNE